MPAHSQAASWIHTAFCSGPRGGERGREGEGRPHDWEDIVIQMKLAAEWSHLGQQFALGSGFLHASPSIWNCPASCKCLFIFGGGKKVCLTQKARKYTVWRGLKELSCPDVLQGCSFVNEILAWDNAGDAEWGEIIVMESFSSCGLPMQWSC